MGKKKRNQNQTGLVGLVHPSGKVFEFAEAEFMALDQAALFIIFVFEQAGAGAFPDEESITREDAETVQRIAKKVRKGKPFPLNSRTVWSMFMVAVGMDTVFTNPLIHDDLRTYLGTLGVNEPGIKALRSKLDVLVSLDRPRRSAGIQA